MNRKILNLTFLAVLITNLYGCMQPIKVTQINHIGEDITVKMNFPKRDVMGNKLNFNTDISGLDISESIIKLSKYDKLQLTNTNRNTALDNFLYEGVSVTKTQYSYTVQYNNIVVPRHPKTGKPDRQFINSNTTSFQYEIPYKIYKNEITFSSPTSFTVHPGSYAFTPIKSLDTIQNMTDDITKIYTSLKNLIAYKEIEYSFSNEINTKYPDRAIYANFKRKLGEYDYGKETDVKKENTFELNLNSKKIPLSVEVYPYRNGSKVMYSAQLLYYVDSRGGLALSKNRIKKLHRMVKGIINN